MSEVEWMRHSAIDGGTRLAYTEVLDDEKGRNAAEFLERAKTWFRRARDYVDRADRR